MSIDSSPTPRTAGTTAAATETTSHHSNGNAADIFVDVEHPAAFVPTSTSHILDRHVRASLALELTSLRSHESCQLARECLSPECRTSTLILKTRERHPLYRCRIAKSRGLRIRQRSRQSTARLLPHPPHLRLLMSRRQSEAGHAGTRDQHLEGV